MFILEEALNENTLTYNWNYIEKIPEFSRLKNCPQNPKWHSEGNAFEHTKKVCEQMLQIITERPCFSSEQIRTLLLSALFHDIGKGVTTEFKKGNWHSYNHEVEGEKITRLLLWNLGVRERENICSLVRWHMKPLDIIENHKKNYMVELCSLSKRCSLNLLLYLKEADIRGSVFEEEERHSLDLKKIEKLRAYSLELNCLYKPSKLPTENVFPSDSTNEDFIVHILIGLPGAGKDTYLKELKKQDEDSVVICRDDIRVELGYCQSSEKIIGTTEQEERVSEVFNERLLNVAKEKKTIIINNINLKRKYRDSYKELLKNYNCKFICHYVEAIGIEKNIERRKGQLSTVTLFKCIENFDFPDYTEYEKIVITTN